MSQLPHKSSDNPDAMLRDSGKSLLESGMFADVTVTCNKKTWKLHKAIICPRCLYFLKAFDGNFNEAKTSTLTLHDQDPADVDAIITFIYTGELPLDLHKSWGLRRWIDFLKCGDFFGLDGTKALAIPAIKLSLRPWANSIVSKGKSSERVLRLDHPILNNILYMADAAYNTGSELIRSTLQPLLLDFMVCTKFYACADPTFNERLHTIPLFSAAVIKHMMPAAGHNVTMLSKCEGLCTTCQSNKELALASLCTEGSRRWSAKGTCWDCYFK